MATLQAARAKTLGLRLASAQSWGLNRAIYYAAAKRGFKGGAGPAKPKKYTATFGEFALGADKAYKVSAGGKTLFTIGGEIQRPEDFRKQIVQRFAGTFREAWEEAVRIMQAYPTAVLESPQQFYLQVYRPRRDVLAAKWTERAAKTSAAKTPETV
ncbi:MAG TPA: hypothetical protein VK201_08795 [bacterium]|nr:hypothetical protein [bacterium]